MLFVATSVPPESDKPTVATVKIAMMVHLGCEATWQHNQLTEKDFKTGTRGGIE